MAHLKSRKALPMSSRIPCLAPEYGSTTYLIRFGGHLRQTQQQEESASSQSSASPDHPGAESSLMKIQLLVVSY